MGALESGILPEREVAELFAPFGRFVGELDKGEIGPFPGAVYELRVIHAGLPLGWRARCTILEVESSNEQRTNRAEEL
jgi:hypothetical protein